MAKLGRPARTPGSITELGNTLTETGELIDTPLTETDFEEEEEAEEPETYFFQLVGTFPRDPQNGTIRYPPSFALSNSQEVYDADTNSRRQARLLNGVSTIWLDEQKDITDKFAARNKPNLQFTNGQLIIPASARTTVQYLMLCSDFEGCKHPAVNKRAKYRLVDTASEEKARLKKRQIIKDASDLAWKADMKDLIVHAKYLGIQMTNDKGLNKTEAALRADYVEKAEAQPDLFLKSYNNPKVKTYGLVKKAFEKDIIVFADGQALWNDTKVVIAQIPPTTTAPDFLAEMMLMKEGKELKARLESL